MPELPEVETICRGIRPHIVGRKIEKITYNGKNLRSPVPIDKMRKLLPGKEITNVRRRAKYLIVEFDNSSVLIIHLGMTGNLGLFCPEKQMAKHCHLRILLSDGMELRYADVRRFGSMHIFDSEEAQELDTNLFRTTGPEPFDDIFSVEYLYNSARNRSIPVKTFIMSNRIVAGVGNIYANESLFRAGIDPRRTVSTISKKSWEQLIDSIRTVLERAIECGGSTISDYVNADQENGYFQIHFQIYGKANEKCDHCGTIIKKVQIARRATYYCPTCQK